MLHALFPDGIPPILAWLAQFSWLIQLGLIVHVFKTGRPYWWATILFIAPGIGGLAYVLIELRPSLAGPRGGWYALKPRAWRIADLRRAVEESNSVTNRLDLAEELSAAGQTQEAHDLAVECLAGPFKNDPRTLVEAARFKLTLGDHAGALAFLERADTTADRRLALEVLVLHADALAGLGRLAEAETGYRHAMERHLGEDARIGLAAVLAKTGRLAEARALWTDIRQKYRRGNAAWRRTERHAYRTASTRLKDAATAPTTTD